MFEVDREGVVNFAYMIHKIVAQGSTLTIARLPGASDFWSGQVKTELHWPDWASDKKKSRKEIKKILQREYNKKYLLSKSVDNIPHKSCARHLKIIDKSLINLVKTYRNQGY